MSKYINDIINYSSEELIDRDEESVTSTLSISTSDSRVDIASWDEDPQYTGGEPEYLEPKIVKVRKYILKK